MWGPIIKAYDSLPSTTRHAQLRDAFRCLIALIRSDLICRACNGALGDDRFHVCKHCGVRVHSWVKCTQSVHLDDIYWCSEQCKTGINRRLYMIKHVKHRHTDTNYPMHMVWQHIILYMYIVLYTATQDQATSGPSVEESKAREWYWIWYLTLFIK